MRTLNLNKTSVWVVTRGDLVEIVDDEGFLTGQFTSSYSEPTEVRLLLYPSNGKISNEIFGKDAKFDMVSVSNEVVLGEDDFIFLSEPHGDYSKTYDYRVDVIKKSLNTYHYGLVRRV